MLSNFPPMLTIQDVAAILQISVRTAYKLVHAGDLPYIHVRGCIRIPRTSVENYLKKELLYHGM